MNTWVIGGVWMVATMVYAWWYASGFVHDPASVGYESWWRFQLLMFAIFRLPFLIIALGVAFFWARRKRGSAF